MEKVMFLVAAASLAVAVWVAHKYGERLAHDQIKEQHRPFPRTTNKPKSAKCPNYVIPVRSNG